MTTLLQTLLLQTLPPDTDPLLRAYIETVLPAMEQEFGMIPALGGSEEAHYYLQKQRGNKFAAENANLLKMLYIADRVALDRMKQPITGDHYVSMDYGPVLSGVYDLIKGKPVDDALPLWSRFISRKDNYVSLLHDPGDEDLCEEEEIIQQVYQAFGHLDPFQVAEWTHDLPEWQDPNGSALPITVEDILKNVGKSDEEISEIQKEAVREAYLDGVLSA